jgi:light-regulated signal transduction histidine kinase (bacteriophytochrome)
VRKLAQLYDGDAIVSSKKGEGSTFTVTLHDPAATAEPGAAPLRGAGDYSMNLPRFT